MPHGLNGFKGFNVEHLEGGSANRRKYGLIGARQGSESAVADLSADARSPGKWLVIIPVSIRKTWDSKRAVIRRVLKIVCPMIQCVMVPARFEDVDEAVEIAVDVAHGDGSCVAIRAAALRAKSRRADDREREEQAARR